MCGERAIVVALCVLATVTVFAESTSPPDDPEPSRRELDAITERGRLIAELDAFAAIATDAVESSGHVWPRQGIYLCSRDEAGRRCAIGVLDEVEQVFRKHFLVTENASSSKLDFAEFSPPSKEEGWLTRAATAFRSAASVFVFHQDAEAYNHVVVAESDGSFSVYLFPATSRKNVRVRGADGVVHVGTDGQATVQRYHRIYSSRS